MIRNKLSGAILMFVLAAVMFMAAGSVAIADVKEAPTRDQIEDKYKWDLTDLFASDEAWEMTYSDIEASLSVFDQFKGKLGTSADLLARCLILSDSLLYSWRLETNQGGG